MAMAMAMLDGSLAHMERLASDPSQALTGPLSAVYWALM
jgi:hypothetical protein